MKESASSPILHSNSNISIFYFIIIVRLITGSNYFSGFLTGCYSEETTKPVEGSRIESASGEKPNLAAMAQPFQEMKSNPVFGKVLHSCEKIAQKNSKTKIYMK